MVDVLRRHGEKFVFGGCTLAALTYLAFGVVAADPNEDETQLNDRITKVKADLPASHPNVPGMTPPAGKPHADEALRPWTQVADARPAPDWAGTCAPHLVGIPKDVVINKNPPPELPKIESLTAEPSVDAVTVTWSIQKVETGFKGAHIARFTLERRTEDLQKWEMLDDRIPADRITFRDETTQPHGRYHYRLTSFCDDKRYIKHFPDGKGMALETPTPTVCPCLWKVDFKNPVGKKIYITIEKYDRELGRIQISRLHEEGDRIGWWKDNTGDTKPTSRHVISHQGKQVFADFGTGMTLDAVKSVTLEITRNRCKPVYERQVKVGCTPVTEPPLTVTVTQVAYTDDEGKKLELLIPDPGSINSNRQACPFCKAEDSWRMIVP